MPEQAANDGNIADIDVAGATEALAERLDPSRETITVNRDRERGVFVSKPDEDDTTPAAGDEAETTDDAATQDGTVTAGEDEAETSFTHIPDEALSPEMLAVKRAMQADYTRKTQEIAEYRKLAQEFEVESPQELRDRLEIQKQLSDPENWPQLHQELTGYLQQQGLSRPVAEQAAAVTLGQAAGDLSDDSVFADDVDDDYDQGVPPALEQRLNEMQQRQDQLVQLLYRREQEQAQQAELAQLAQQLTTQENDIRAKYGSQWGDKAEEYIETIYDLSGDGGDLSVGLSRLETILGYDASRYLVGKEQAKRAPGPVVGDGVISSESDEAPHTLEEGHARALEYVRQQAEAEAGL